VDRLEIEAFFERYRDAFNALDADAVADLWHTPSSITDTPPGDVAARVTLWTDDASKRRNMHALCDVYVQNDYGRAEFAFDHHLPLGPNHAFVNLYWRLWRTDGTVLQEFHTAYHLLRTEEGPKVLMANAYEEDVGRMKLYALEH
jgi:hypothetical protein